MKSFTICTPILPGKSDSWKAFTQELAHARKVEFDAMMKRLGVSRSRTWLQKTPQGDVAFVLHEGSSPDRMMTELAKANDPFAVWFKSKMTECYGVDMNASKVSVPVATELKMDCLH